MRRLLGLLVLLLLLAPAQAMAARLALVIGIDSYESLSPLDRAVGDARAMAQRLGELGFGVTEVLNPNRRDLSLAITAFRQSLKPGDMAFVHYSGHGVEINGRNLLLPRDMPLPTMGAEDFLISESIDLNDLMTRIAESGATVRIFVIDACRNNPFPERGVRGVGGVGGLAITTPPNGTFVLYSAGFRQTALDRLNADDMASTSVYTRVLLEQLAVPGASISDVARGVRGKVAALAESVGHQQSPAYYDELNQEVVLSPEPAAKSVAGDTAPAVAEAFEVARQINSVDGWQVFLQAYGKGFHADMARVALRDLLARSVEPTRVSATPEGGLVASFTVPLKGKIVDWALQFSFTTECEADHRIIVTSASGNAINVMDRGLKRCSGTPVTFTGGADGPRDFAGTEASGEWRFTMWDLDKNNHTGTLNAVSLRLVVRNDDITTEQTIALTGLPAAVPSPL
ncbi:caspase family protein [Devosia sp. CN2-171]|uniref:caspase family protein n=1 Tax=Devosia sp. CN2-171 TaxID=3400909 RepID=UPI003BF89696